MGCEQREKAPKQLPATALTSKPPAALARAIGEGACPSGPGTSYNSCAAAAKGDPPSVETGLAAGRTPAKREQWLYTWLSSQPSPVTSPSQTPFPPHSLGAAQPDSSTLSRCQILDRPTLPAMATQPGNWHTWPSVQQEVEPGSSSSALCSWHSKGQETPVCRPALGLSLQILTFRKS